MNRRLLALLMSIVMLVSALPVQAFASDIMETEEIAAETVAETETAETAQTEETKEPAVQTTAATEFETVAAEEAAAMEETEITEPEEETVPEETEEVPSERIVQDSEGVRRTVTSGTFRESKDVRVIEQGENGSLNYYDTTVTEEHTTTLLDRTSEQGISSFSLTEDFGDYTFTTFADLLELSDMRFTNYASALYEGEGPLVIASDVTLPGYLELHFYEDNSQIIIPEGVVLSTANSTTSIYVDNMVVDGSFVNRGYTKIEKSLEVNGQVTLYSDLYLGSSAVLSGEENIVDGNGWNVVLKEFFCTTGEELAAAASAAMAAEDGCLYDISFYPNGDVTLNTDITFTPNVSLYVYGYSETLTIAQGCTLTLNCADASFNIDVVVNGTLENNCSNVWLQYDNGYTMTFSGTGDYRGGGMLQIAVPEDADSYEGAVPGMDLTNVQAIEIRDELAHYWRLQNLSGLVQLGTPTDLTWHKDAVLMEHSDGSYKVVLMDAPGYMAWKPAAPDQGLVEVIIYREGDAEPYEIAYWSFVFDELEDWRAVHDFVMCDPENGTYYFTVQSLAASVDCYDSNVAKSGLYQYTQPARQLAAPTNLKWNWPAVSFDATSEYVEIEWLFASGPEEEPIYCGGSWSPYTQEQKPEIYEKVIQDCGEGYYYYRVRSISDNIDEVRTSEWSALSEPYCTKDLAGDILNRLEAIKNNAATPEEICHYVQALNTTELLAAMEGDNAENGILAALAELEEAAGGAAAVRVDDPDSVFAAEQIHVLGANLNEKANPNMGITLVIDKMAGDHVLEDLYDSPGAVSFSMELENAAYQENLEVPVVITMPVPHTLEHELLTVLRYTQDGEAEIIRPTRLFREDGQWYASLILTGFGDFVMTQEMDLFTQEEFLAELEAAEAEGDMYYLTRPVKIHSHMVLPAGLAMTIRDGGSLTVCSGAALSVHKRIYVHIGSRITVENGGTLEFVDAGSADFYDGGILYLKTGATVDTTGSRMYDMFDSGSTLEAEPGVTVKGSHLNVNLNGAKVIGLEPSQLSAHAYVDSMESMRNAIEAGADYIYVRLYAMDDSFAITRDLEIPANTQLDLYNWTGETQIEVADGATLINNGEIYLDEGGILLIQSGGTLINNGNIGIYAGKLINLGTLVNHGSMSVNADGTVESKGSFEDDGNLWIDSEATVSGLSKVQIRTEKTVLTSGEKLELEAEILPEGTAETKLVWSIVSGSAYVSLKATASKATVTAQTVSKAEKVVITVSAEDDTLAPGTVELTILPKTAAVSILSAGEDVTGGTLSFDINSNTMELPLTAKAEPGDANQTFQWTSSSEKIATVTDGVVTFTGTDGKVKITAMALDGSKKYASVTIETIRVPHNVEKEDTVEGDADIAILGGKTHSLVVYDKDTGKALTNKQITWSMDEKYAAFASVDAKGKLKTQKVVTLTRVEAVGTITGSSDDPVVYVIDIYPAVTHVEILKDSKAVNGQTLNMTGDTMTFHVSTYPTDAIQGVTWTNPDAKKMAYAQYTENGDGSLTISAPTGKAGTLTLKATSNDGSKKTATVKIQFGILAESLEIEIPMIQSVRSGGSLNLTAKVTPEKVTKPGIVWSLADSADSAYVTVSNGKVKAKTVTENHYVTINAVSKDGNASDSITVLVMPKEEETLILKSGEEYLTGRTKAMDSSESTAMELSAFLLINPTYGQFGEEPENVTWTSSKPEIASVSSETGETVTVTLHKTGTAVITAKDSTGRKATVTIKGSVLVDEMTISVKEAANLTANGIEVASGKAVTLLAATNSNAANKKVTWTITEGAEYASITSAGKLTANKDLTSVKRVKVLATAADGSGKTAEVTVTVRPAAQGVQVYTVENGVQTFTTRSDDSWWVRNNTTAQWDVTTQGDVITMGADVYPFYGEGNDRNAMQAVSWKSSAPKIADFVKDENGKLLLDAEGNVQLKVSGTGSITITVTAEDGSKQKVSFKLNVVKHVSDFRLAPQVLASGKSLNLAKLLEIQPTGTTTKKLSWAITGGADYATISSSGTLKAKTVTEHKQVEVTVTAQDALAYSESFTIDLYPATTKVLLFSGSEEVTGKTLTLAAGESIQLTADCQPENAANVYTWKSSKAAAVDVDEEGNVTVIGGSGTVTITCTAADGSGKKATVKIKVG